MQNKWCRVFFWGVALLVLAGCNLSSDEKEPANPTPPGGSPVAWATARQTETITPDEPAVTLPTLTSAPTLTTAPTLTAQLEDGDLPTKTALPTLTPAEIYSPPVEVVSSQTNTPLGILTPTGAPALTDASPDILTPTNAPTLTNTPMGIISLTPVPTATQTIAPPPTFTPVIVAPTEIAAVLPNAQVCSTCGGLRLRQQPGAGGEIITMLLADAPLTITGRTEDNVWLQVTTADGSAGWVAAEYLVININLNAVDVTGSEVEAPTVNPDVRPDELNIVTGVSSNARRIFLDGLAKGNSAYTFTRVGDSITAAPQFLIPIGAGNYSLGEYSNLGGAISFFSGPNGRGANPFAALSLAARNGWGTTSILDPANADPNICNPGETPLHCEYRLVKPAVALIMVGTNDSGGLPTVDFTANLHTIVQTSINMGVIPVLSTIPPKHYDARTDGRVDEFNQVIIATARAYDVPLWNYWLAMRNTPGEGLSEDGVHPSTPPDSLTTVFDAEHLQYGYTVRNLTALQVLYTLWQQVLYDGDSAIPATYEPIVIVDTPVWVDLDTYACPGAPEPRLTVGGQGRVTPGLPNKVRSSATLNGTQIGSIPGEGVFNVLGGPECADGLNWWQVDYNGLIGWTADGTATEYWLEPYP